MNTSDDDAFVGIINELYSSKLSAAGGTVSGDLAISGNLSVTGNFAPSAVTTPCEVVTAANVITASESGKTFFLDNETGFASTLPAPALGLNFTFINKTANTSGNHTVISSASANIIKGNQNSVDGDAGDGGSADDTISFVANQSVAGDQVRVVSDGTSWFAYAVSRAAAGITFTQAS